MRDLTVLVADDEPLIRRAIGVRLEQEGYSVVEAADGQSALDQAARGIDLAILDVRLPDLDGLRVLERLKHVDPDTIVIVMTAFGDVDVAVDAVKHGAYQFLRKPFDLEALVAMVDEAFESTRLLRDARRARDVRSDPFGIRRIVGTAPAMVAFKARLRRVAESPASTVLLTGESGTGKDLTAKVLHTLSRRASRPFVNITCSALPDTLLESELFGHERGAFTDARQQKRGLLEMADGGTVYLDEIGEMAPPLQAKLLRFLEDKVLRRVGGTHDLHVDVRVVAATNRDLGTEVHEGRFREDLFYRLNVLPLDLPPLRDRPEDVPALVAFYIDIFNREFERTVQGASPAAIDLLTAHGWPGNVRELRNVIERAMLLSPADVLEPDDFPALSSAGGAPALEPLVRLPPGGVRLEDVERSLLLQALERTGWNQTRAAALLGLNRDQIHYRIDKFQLRKKA